VSLACSVVAAAAAVALVLAGAADVAEEAAVCVVEADPLEDEVGVELMVVAAVVVVDVDPLVWEVLTDGVDVVPAVDWVEFDEVDVAVAVDWVVVVDEVVVVDVEAAVWRVLVVVGVEVLFAGVTTTTAAVARALVAVALVVKRTWRVQVPPEPVSGMRRQRTDGVGVAVMPVARRLLTVAVTPPSQVMVATPPLAVVKRAPAPDKASAAPAASIGKGRFIVGAVTALVVTMTVRSSWPPM